MADGPGQSALRRMAGGSELRWLRETANLTVREAAEILHVSPFELSTWEGRARRVPDNVFELVRRHYNLHQKPEGEQEPIYVPGQTEAEVE